MSTRPRSDTHSGGDDLIRILATIANNKHTVGLTIDANISSTTFPTITGGQVQSLRMLEAKWNPIKNEADLIKWIGDVRVEGAYEFEFQVLLKDAKLKQPLEIVSGLQFFMSKAKTVNESLRTRCLELCQ